MYTFAKVRICKRWGSFKTQINCSQGKAADHKDEITVTRSLFKWVQSARSLVVLTIMCAVRRR